MFVRRLRRLDVAASWQRAREEFRKLTTLLAEERAFRLELMCELADLRRDLREIRSLVYRRHQVITAVEAERGTPLH
jgi:hypothetical protein